MEDRALMALSLFAGYVLTVVGLCYGWRWLCRQRAR